MGSLSRSVKRQGRGIRAIRSMPKVAMPVVMPEFAQPDQQAYADRERAVIAVRHQNPGAMVFAVPRDPQSPGSPLDFVVVPPPSGVSRHKVVSLKEHT